MRLVDLGRKEFKEEYDEIVEYEEIVLFRHTQKDTDVVLKYCKDIGEWTSCQPSKGKYDYRMDGRTKILVVIVDHCIDRVLRVGDTEDKGPRGEISSDALKRSFEERAESLNERNMADEPAFRVALKRVRFSKDGASIIGWEGKGICTMAPCRLKSGKRGKLAFAIEVQ